MKTTERILTEDLTGEDVASLQRGLDQLGYEIAEDERKASHFGPQTRRAVEEFQADQQLPRTSVVDEATGKAFARVYHASTYTVSGWLTSSNTAHALGGLTIELVDRNVGHDLNLATTNTRPDGSFAFGNVIVSQKSLSSRHKAKPDLQARALGSAGLLATSTVHYNAPQEVRLNIALPSSAKGLESEVEALTAALKEVYADKIADLKETADQPDIT